MGGNSEGKGEGRRKGGQYRIGRKMQKILLVDKTTREWIHGGGREIVAGPRYHHESDDIYKDTRAVKPKPTAEHTFETEKRNEREKKRQKICG